MKLPTVPPKLMAVLAKIPWPQLPKLLDRDKEFYGKLAEQVLVTFLVAFLAVFGAVQDPWTAATLSASVSAGLRALYGYAVRWKGSGVNDPNLK